MNTILKISSNEGGVFDAQNNHLSFDIPSGKYFDLTTAYINLVMSCPISAQDNSCVSAGPQGVAAAAEQVAGAALDATSVYIPKIKFVTSGNLAEDLKYENSALIRSVKMDCELRGSIEDIQRCDVLTHNLNGYSRSEFQQTSHLYERLCSEVAVSRTKSSIFNEIHREGNIISRNKQRVPVRIKLSDIMNFCKTTQFNTGKYGKTRIECELNMDRLRTPEQYLGNAFLPDGGGGNNGSANRGGPSTAGQVADSNDWQMGNEPVFLANLRTAAELGNEGNLGQTNARNGNATNSQMSSGTGNSVCRMMNCDPTADVLGNPSNNAVTAACNRPGALAGVSVGRQTFYPCADTNPNVVAAPTGGVTGDTTAPSAVTGGKVPRIFNRLEDCPFYVGQKVRVSCNTFGGGAAAAGLLGRHQRSPYIRQITRIEYNRGDGVGLVPGAPTATAPPVGANEPQGGVNVPGAIAITLNAPLPGAISGTARYVDIAFTGATCTFDPIRCDFAELVIEELAAGNVVAEPDTISYSTFKTEEIDCGGSSNFQHQFMGHPNAMNMYIMQPSDQTSGSINSFQGLLENYRIRVNNKDTSSRQIFLRDSGTSILPTGQNRSQCNDPLHIHKQQSALINSDRVVKNLCEAPMELDNNDGTMFDKFLGARRRAPVARGSENNMLIGQVLPLTAQPKTIQVNLQTRPSLANAAGIAAAGIKNLIVFQEVLQEI